MIEKINNNKPTILLTLGSGGRGNPATGPVSSLLALTEQLNDKFNFIILAHPRTFGLPLGKDGEIILKDNVRYLLHTKGYLALRSKLNNKGYDAIVLNSFFDREFTIPYLLLSRLNLLPRSPVLLAPRGEFGKGALSLKSNKKKLFVSLIKALSLLKRCWIHTTVPHETDDVKSMKFAVKGIIEAPNLRASFQEFKFFPREDGLTRLIFLGRVAKVKNITFALDVLSRIKTPISLDIYGVLSEPEYWSECKELIDSLPENVEVNYKGILHKRDIAKKMSTYDLFFMPTLGENFGHSINEALMSGLPCLISDTTPWLNLKALDAGWSLPLKDINPFVEAIEEYVSMSSGQRLNFRRGARKLAKNSAQKSNAREVNIKMLNKVINN